MKDKIFQLIDKIKCPYLVLDKNNNIVFLNKFFIENFLNINLISFTNVNNFDADWEKFRAFNEVVIINKYDSNMFTGEFLSEFVVCEEKYDEIFRIYNFNNCLKNQKDCIEKIKLYFNNSNNNENFRNYINDESIKFLQINSN